jgi:quercetin dioxygenase-like cupin family protein
LEIVKIQDVKAADRPDVLMKTLLDRQNASGSEVTLGTVIFPPGARVPAEGMGVHEADEYSIILKGSIKTMSGGREYQVSGGQVTFIPAGEEHWAFNDSEEDCEIIWFLVKN